MDRYTTPKENFRLVAAVGREPYSDPSRAERAERAACTSQGLTLSRDIKAGPLLVRCRVLVSFAAAVFMRKGSARRKRRQAAASPTSRSAVRRIMRIALRQTGAIVLFGVSVLAGIAAPAQVATWD